jgi:hypothetical protein
VSDHCAVKGEIALIAAATRPATSESTILARRAAPTATPLAIKNLPASGGGSTILVETGSPRSRQKHTVKPRTRTALSRVLPRHESHVPEVWMVEYPPLYAHGDCRSFPPPVLSVAFSMPHVPEAVLHVHHGEKPVSHSGLTAPPPTLPVHRPIATIQRTSF